MHLFLTSSPCDDNVPEGCDLPCILFERNRFVELLKERFQPGCRCAMVAAYPQAFDRNDEMAETFHRAFCYHGMHLAQTTMVDDRNVEELPRLIQESGVVILAGGHEPTENAFFTRIGLKKQLQGYRGMIMGISAGTMNCCTTVYAQPEEPGEATDSAYQRFLPGLGLTDVMVLPHYQQVKDSTVDGLRLFEDITLPDSRGHTFYALPDASFVLVEEGRATLCGEGWRIRDGVMTQISWEGDMCIL